MTASAVQTPTVKIVFTWAVLIPNLSKKSQTLVPWALQGPQTIYVTSLHSSNTAILSWDDSTFRTRFDDHKQQGEYARASVCKCVKQFSMWPILCTNINFFYIHSLRRHRKPASWITQAVKFPRNPGPPGGSRTVVTTWIANSKIAKDGNWDVPLAALSRCINRCQSGWVKRNTHWLPWEDQFLGSNCYQNLAKSAISQILPREIRSRSVILKAYRLPKAVCKFHLIWFNYPTSNGSENVCLFVCLFVCSTYSLSCVVHVKCSWYHKGTKSYEGYKG